MLDLIGLCTGSRVMGLRIFPNDSEGVFLTIISMFGFKFVYHYIY